MQVSRKQLAAFLATIFVVNLVVMGGGARLSYANEPEIPDTIVGPDGDTVATTTDDPVDVFRARNASLFRVKYAEQAGTANKPETDHDICVYLPTSLSILPTGSRGTWSASAWH